MQPFVVQAGSLLWSHLELEPAVHAHQIAIADTVYQLARKGQLAFGEGGRHVANLLLSYLSFYLNKMDTDPSLDKLASYLQIHDSTNTSIIMTYRDMI